MAIPKILHQIWMQGKNSVPEKYADFRASWVKHHPDIQVMTWDEKSLIAFMQQHYPDDAVMVEQYEHLVQRCDVARCFLLHHFGGIYADMDFECLKSFAALLQSKSFLIGKMDAHIVNNGLIASQPGDALWQAIFTELRTRFRKRRFIRAFSLGLKSLYVMRTTGPALYGKVLKNNQREDVYVAPQIVFYPKPWIGRKYHTSNEFSAESLAVHHWEHSWVDKVADKAILNFVALLPRKKN